MSNIPYACGRAVSLEKNLLGSERINRMINSGDPAEAVKILSEVNFGGGVTVSSFINYEKLIGAEEELFVSFIRENCPSKSLRAFLLKKNDYHNAEVLVREKYLKTDLSHILTHDGLIKKDALKKGIMSDSYKDFPQEMQAALTESDRAFAADTATGSLINMYFIRAYFNDLYSFAKKDRYLLAIYRAKADAANITAALRSRDIGYMESAFIPHGNINLKDVPLLCEGHFEDIRAAFRFSEFRDLIFSAVQCAEKDMPLTEFEKSADGYAVSYLMRYKFQSGGMLPFIRYCFYKLADISNVRIILAGLINGEKGADIKDRLREHYAG